MLLNTHFIAGTSTVSIQLAYTATIPLENEQT